MLASFRVQFQESSPSHLKKTTQSTQSAEARDTEALVGSSTRQSTSQPAEGWTRGARITTDTNTAV